MVKAKKKLHVPGIGFADHRKSARSLARQIFYTRGMAKKEPLYNDLLSQAEQVMKDSNEALWHVQLCRFRGPRYGQLPERIAADGGYASSANLKEARGLGVSEVAFQKKKGLTVEAMTSSQKIYKQLCDFRAGIESNISELKRAYGLKRSLWRGFQGFMADVWSSIVSYNLVRIARLNSS